MPPALSNRRRAPGAAVRVAIVFGGALTLAIVIMALTGLFSSDDAGVGPSGRSAGTGPPAASARGRKPEGRIAVILRPTVLRSAPGGGRRLARMRTKTEFQSARVVPVLAERDGWLRVMASELPNGQRGWIQARDTQQGIVDYRIRVDVSERRLTVIRNGRVARRVTTAVGEAGTPTPHGTFAVTDLIPFTDAGSPYGCCALALTAHQPDTPSEWSGGDRIAIHATPATSSIGRPVTLGCMRVPADDARWLMRNIPLGTQVSIRA
jgi:hypothetical protein